MADTRRLPVPTTDVWSWQMHGACRGVDTAVFFHPDRERGPAKAAREARAKRVCVMCPVIEECRRHALAVREPYGVWGGLTVAERAQVRRVRAPRRTAGTNAGGGRRDEGPGTLRGRGRVTS